MKKLLFCLLLLCPPLHAYELPYSVDDTAIYEDLEYLIGRINSLDSKFILNNSTSPGFTQFYVTSGTVAGPLLVGSINLLSGGSFLDTTGSNQTKIGSATFQGGIASTGPVTIGSATFSNPSGNTGAFIPGSGVVQWSINDAIGGNAFLLARTNGDIYFPAKDFYISKGTFTISNPGTLGRTAAFLPGSGPMYFMITDGAGLNLINARTSGDVVIPVGDIVQTTQGKGMVLKSTNDASCWRVTVNSAGTLATASVTCP